MQTTTVLSIRDDFSESPALRYMNLSENSAEKFYHDVLNQRFAEVAQDDITLEVNLDFTAGYTSSFLDEAFGNLVYDFTLELVLKHLKVTSIAEPYWLDMLNEETFPQWEKRRIEGKAPIKTAVHAPWFKYINGNYEKKVWINV